MRPLHQLTAKFWFFVAVEVWNVVYACPETGGACICDSNSRSVTCTRITGNQNRLPIGIPSDTQALTINKSTLKKIGPTAFKSIGSLTSVDLSSNRIEVIAENSLSDLPRLKILSLADNRIRLMGENVFIRSNTLVKVDLSGNHIIVLTPFNFQGLKNLEELLLLRNPTMCIAVDAFAGLLKLRRLEMSGMNATLDSKLFSGLGDLRVLVIRDFIHVEEIPKDIFVNNTRLEKLYLEDLSLSTEFDPMLLKPLKNLDDLSLKNCRLSKIPFEMLDAVKDSLTSLDVSHNPLFTLSESDLRSLKILKVLKLRNTGLRLLPKNSLALKYLMILDLSGNKLTTLKKSVFGRYYRSLRNITLGYNPWVCDCMLRWLVEGSVTHSREIPVTCSEPSAMKGIDIRHASRALPNEVYFKCEKPTITRFGISEKEVERLPNKQGRTEFDAFCDVQGFPQAEVAWILPSFKDNDPRTRRSLSSERNEDKNFLYSWISFAKDIAESREKRDAKNGDNSKVQDFCSLCEVSSRHNKENIWVSEDGTLHARDLPVPLSLGVYACQAVNDYGLSRKSFIISDVITPKTQADETKSSPVINAYGNMQNEEKEKGVGGDAKWQDKKGGNGNGERSRVDYDDYNYFQPPPTNMKLGNTRQSSSNRVQPLHGRKKGNSKHSSSPYYPLSLSYPSSSFSPHSSAFPSSFSDFSSRSFNSLASSSYYPSYSNSPSNNKYIPIPLQSGTKPVQNHSSTARLCQRVECKTHNKIKHSDSISGSNTGGVFYQSTEGRLSDPPYYELVMAPDFTAILPSESHAPCCGNYARSNGSRMLSAVTCVLVTLILVAPF